MTQPVQSRNVVPLRSTHNPAAMVETVVIALMILEPACASVAFGMLQDHDFSVRPEAVKVLRVLHVAGTLDHVTAASELSRIYKREFVLEEAFRAYEQYQGSPVRIEEYCRLVLAESQRQKAKKLTQDTLQRLNQTDANTGDVLQLFRSGAQEIELHGIQAKRVSTFAELDAQIESEITGERSDFGWPWPIMGTSCSMMPGSTMTICGGSGEGKSFFTFEALWRPFFNGLPVSSLNLEKHSTFHMRRCLAQMAGTNGMMHDKWCREHSDDSRRIKADFRPSMEQLEFAKVFQTPGEYEQPTVDYVIRWIRDELTRGVKVLLIDPVTNIEPSRAGRLSDEEKLVRECNRMAGHFQAVIIFVTHPKSNVAGVPLRPSRYNMAGSQAFHRFVDSVFWLTSHKDKEDYIETNFGRVVSTYNRTMFWLKTKLTGDGKMDKKIAFKFLYGTLCYEELGVIAQEED